jgi:hypothetical protein
MLRALSLFALISAPAHAILQVDILADLVDESCYEQISGEMHLLNHDEPYPTTLVAGPDGFPLRIHLIFNYDDQITSGLVTRISARVGESLQHWDPEMGTLVYGQGPLFPVDAVFEAFPPCLTAVGEGPSVLPEGLGLQAAPNPFNPSTQLRFELPQAAEVRLELFGLDGNRLRDLFTGWLGGGHHSLMLHAGDLASGLYLLRVSAGERQDMLRLLLLK